MADGPNAVATVVIVVLDLTAVAVMWAVVAFVHISASTTATMASLDDDFLVSPMRNMRRAVVPSLRFADTHRAHAKQQANCNR